MNMFLRSSQRKQRAGLSVLNKPTHPDPVRYVREQFSGGGVSPLTQWRQLDGLKHDNALRLKATLDSNGNATGYGIYGFSQLAAIRQAIEARRNDIALETWSAYALRHALGEAAVQAGELNIAVFDLHKPVVAGDGSLRWETTLSNIRIETVCATDQADQLLQRADLEVEAVRARALGQLAASR